MIEIFKPTGVPLDRRGGGVLKKKKGAKRKIVSLVG